MYNDYEELSILTGGLVGGFIAFFGILLIISLAVAVIMIISEWKIFEKAEKPGWAAIIPVYNVITLCNVVGISPWWILIVVLSPILNIVPVLGALAKFAVIIYFQILLNVSLARAFKKEDGFAAGLILLPVVFYPILGFGKDNKFYGKNPMKDLLFDNLKENKNDSNVNEAQYEETKKFCPSCGAKMEIDTKYCPKCGKEL